MTTTTLPTTARRALVSAHNRCIRAATDAQKGYSRAATEARDPELKVLFQARSDERAQYILGLQHAVSELGGRAEHSGSIEGALHRAWIGTRIAVEGHNDLTIVRECERGERACLSAYDTLLWIAGSDGLLPHSLRSMIAKQHSEVRASLADLSRRLVSQA